MTTNRSSSVLLVALVASCIARGQTQTATAYERLIQAVTAQPEAGRNRDAQIVDALNATRQALVDESPSGSIDVATKNALERSLTTVEQSLSRVHALGLTADSPLVRLRDGDPDAPSTAALAIGDKRLHALDVRLAFALWLGPTSSKLLRRRFNQISQQLDRACPGAELTLLSQPKEQDLETLEVAMRDAKAVASTLAAKGINLESDNQLYSPSGGALEQLTSDVDLKTQVAGPPIFVAGTAPAASNTIEHDCGVIIYRLTISEMKSWFEKWSTEVRAAPERYRQEALETGRRKYSNMALVLDVAVTSEPTGGKVVRKLKRGTTVDVVDGFNFREPTTGYYKFNGSIEVSLGGTILVSGDWGEGWMPSEFRFSWQSPNTSEEDSVAYLQREELDGNFMARDMIERAAFYTVNRAAAVKEKARGVLGEPEKFEEPAAEQLNEACKLKAEYSVLFGKSALPKVIAGFRLYAKEGRGKPADVESTIKTVFQGPKCGLK